MRFVLLFLLSGFFTLNCASFSKPNETKSPEPVRQSGCAKYKGSLWFECLERLHARWEKIESSEAIVTLLSETREAEFIRKKKRICWSEYFCHTYDQVTYSPSYIQRVWETLVIAIPSLAIGVLVGLSL
ncbi:hypothetical protein CH370_19910 [Leptospira kmetyi]|uniref:Lipoprotein n=1 Tax=Leptospira kmetyi TaxID=408139 RepID=A0ABX4N6U8_9LEPT|nr:hypothetical protein [Leptospira kmetyi]PJZ29113.1 hypothetical protein CH378_14605 [Leptospira kmetyi]PJZ39720.1 hypothetical protein CH370_19910 [Leptospira kmetyi]